MKSKTLSTISAILMVGSIAGVVVTTGLAAYISPKAKEKMEKKEDAKGKPLTKTEIIKEIGPICTPCICSGIVTIGCIVGSNTISKKQLASMSAVLAISSQYMKRYKDKIKGLYGNIFEKELSEKVKSEIPVEKPPVTNFSFDTLWAEGTNQSEDNPGTNMLFYDVSSGTFFEKTLEQVLLAEYHLNRDYVTMGEVTLNEWYYYLGLTDCMSDINDNLIWAPLDDTDFWIDFKHTKKTNQDGQEYYEIDIANEPYHLDEVYEDLYGREVGSQK